MLPLFREWYERYFTDPQILILGVLLLVGFACNDPLPTCFCTSVGGDPAGTAGLDILLTELDDMLPGSAPADPPARRECRYSPRGSRAGAAPRHGARPRR